MDEVPSATPSPEGSEPASPKRSSVRGERCPNCGQPLVLGQCTFCGYRPATAAPAAPPPPSAPSTGPQPATPTAPGPTAAPSPSGPAPSFTPMGSSASTPPPAPPPRRPSAGGDANANPWIVGLACVVAVLLVLSVFLLLQLSSLNSKIKDARDAQNAAADHVTGLEGQIRVVQADDKAIREQLDAQAKADPTVIASEDQPSVYTIETSAGQGSAWIAQSDPSTSKFVTNYHVIADTWEKGDKTVTLYQDPNGARYEGTIEQALPNADLALISAPVSLPALKQSSEAVRPGQQIVAIGSPLGLGGSVSTGDVSATRDIDGVNYIQFDASVTFGSSGGPIVNSVGEVVGVTEAGFVLGNIALAIPVAQVCTQMHVC